MRWKVIPAVVALCASATGCQQEPAARPSDAPEKSMARMATDIPPAITMPDTVDTRLGPLGFKDGFPDEATVQKVYDNLDFQRGVQVLLTSMPAASLVAWRRAIRSFGPDNQTVIIFESLMDSKSLFLTANTESIYALAWLNLKDGPIVVESPPNTLGLVDDFWFRYVTDLGNAGPDKGKGGKFLFLPPGYKGNVPTGYYVLRSRTFNNQIGTRGFLVNGDPKPAVDSIKQRLRIYPLAQAAKPPATSFVNVSGRSFNTIHSMDFSFFEEVNELVQEEPAEATDPETLGLLASVGIVKGAPFAPDARMKQILTDAASVGQATVRTLAYRTRTPEARLYPNSAWETAFIGGSYEFLHEGARLLDARSFFFFYATGITPAMSMKMVGVGSQYAAAFVDAKGQPLDGGKTYRLRLPSGIPAKDFWSLVLYDNQTRSQLQTNQQFPSIGSQKTGVAINPDTSVDIYFGPTPPAGKESNWVQTWPGKGWNLVLRLYGPLQPFFDKTWKPGEIEEMSGAASAQNAAKPKMATDIPPAITTPDKVETRLGTLAFKDGFPDDATVQKVYDNLDFQRGVQAFLNTMPAASLSAMREGLKGVGATNNSVAVFESLLDSKTLFLTPNTESIYFSTWLDLKAGPIVVESPPNILGFVNDFWFKYVTDMGNAGPDKGKGGKFLFLPPGYKGAVPTGYFVSRPNTFGLWLVGRGFMVNGSPAPAVESIKKSLRIYPLSQAAKPPATTFINTSGKAFNTIHAMDGSFFGEVDKVVQEEPASAIDPETLGLLAAIGIEKGKPFRPDERMGKILGEAAAVGSATARAITYRSRLKESRLFPTGSWGTGFVGGSYEFLHNGARMLDAYTSFFFIATGITPAMTVERVGVGSQYAGNYVDSMNRPLDGGRTYKLTLPAGIPAQDFWSLVLYDTQTESELQTDQQFPSIGSQKAGVVVNADKSVDVYFGPKAPPGKESNWVQTMPGKGWFVILRLYGPLQPWFDRSWQPGEIQEVR